MSRNQPILEAFLRGRFSLFLITMVAMFFVMPLVGQEQGLVDKILGWLSIAVLLSCMRAISNSRRFFILMAVLTGINIVLTGTENMITKDIPAFDLAVLGFSAFYYILVFFSIMRFVLNSDPVTADKIYGAISAYMVMGIIWAYIYTMFYEINAASFKIPEAWLTYETVNSFWAYYFSFTTLTTLGYGDITPQTPATQAYAIMQAAIGQVFLAVIVARLIALHISYERGHSDQVE